MKFIKFYSVASAVLIAVLMVQRGIYLNWHNEMTHSLGFALTGLIMSWWIVSIVAIFKFKREGMSFVLPLSWIAYQISMIVLGIPLRSVFDSNPTINAVWIAFLFVADGGFVTMFAMLAKRLFARSENAET